MPLTAWLCSSLKRQFPAGVASRNAPLRLLAARGERVSFQVGFVLAGHTPAEVAAGAAASGGLRTRVRRVGHVPLPHFNTECPPEELDGVGLLPGLVPDPLFPETVAQFAPCEVGAFWITVDVPPDAKPGVQHVEVELRQGDKTAARLRAVVEVSKVVIKPRKDFHACHWFYADALCDWYKVDPWEEAFWPICEKYMRNFAEHGLDMIYVPAFTQPTDGVKRPTQLLHVRKMGPDLYAFDWTHVKRWIALARRCGIHHFEWVHLFTQWGVRHALRIYEGHGLDERLLWPPETGATSDTYRKFLAQFLPELHKFLLREGLLERSFFHVSDEPHGDEHLANYKAARALLKELAPWMKVMDALSDIRFAREGLTDTPIPSIQTALQFVEEGIPSWCYYCCGPRGHYLNRLLDSPLAKIRMNGWLFYRWSFAGFLHWGHNYWYRSQTRQLIDPFTVTDALWWPGWAYGDPFMVYPGPAEHGPIDSIRWEVFGESLQDYALLQTLGVEAGGKLLSPLKSFENFPKSEKWIVDTRRKLLTGRGAV